ncbi:hypothetical protein E4T56_gene1320 [Termitomyces sp. T112]|nr:hypothetical protein E4T56_gene1320 [Termitomyces sp. T112]
MFAYTKKNYIQPGEGGGKSESNKKRGPHPSHSLPGPPGNPTPRSTSIWDRTTAKISANPGNASPASAATSHHDPGATALHRQCPANNLSNRAIPCCNSRGSTPEAELRIPASTHPESMQTPWKHRPRGPDAPAPSLNPENELSVTNGGMGDNSQRIPVRPEAASLANQSSLRLAASSSTHNASPSGTRPHPSASPRAAPPSVPDAPTSPAPLTLAPSPHAPKCSSPAPSLLSPSTPHHDPPLPTSVIKGIGAGGLDDHSEGMPGTGEKREDSGGPADNSRPRGLLLGPAPEGGEARRFPRTIAEDTPFPFGNAGQNLVRFRTPGKSTTTTTDDSTGAPSIIQKEKSTTLTTLVPDATPAPTLELLTPTIVHHHLVQISGRDYWNAGGRHDEIWETPGHAQSF